MVRSASRPLARGLLSVVWLAVPAAVGGWWSGLCYDHAHYAGVSAVGVVLVLLVGFLPVERWHSKVGRVLLVLWAGGVLGWLSQPPAKALMAARHANYWSGFHYYFGPKYFAELGYDGLYDQALAADAQTTRRWSTVSRIRDLKSYERVPAVPWTRARDARWTDARWEEFKSDIVTMQPLLDDRLWARVLNDRGYNAPPSFTFFHEKLGVITPDRVGFTWLALLDPLMLVVALVVVGHVVGAVPALVAGAWLMLFFGNDSFRIFQVQGLYDYLAALILAVAALRGRRPALAGVGWAYAVMARIFPGVLLLGPAVWVARRWRKDPQVRWMARRFGLAFAVSAVVLLLLGGATGRGMGAWVEFADTIGMHSAEHRFGDQRVGLQHLFTRDWSRAWGDWEQKVTRHQTWPRQEPLWMASAGGLGLLWLVAVWRNRRDDPGEVLALSFAVVFSMIVLSRYYWSTACLWPLLLARDRRLGPRAALSVVALLVLGVVYEVYAGGEGDKFGRYVLVNLVMGLGWLAALLGAAVRPGGERA